jgi:hypothetical protein
VDADAERSHGNSRITIGEEDEMKRVQLALISSVVVVQGCGNPCRDYCETFVDRTQECGLGGRSGDAVVDQCSDEVDKVFTDDACEQADDKIKTMSCAEFKQILCGQQGASGIYNCK